MRSLRAALAKFAELAPLTRPSKCRVFVTSLIPPLVAILQRTGEESLQVGWYFVGCDVKYMLDVQICTMYVYAYTYMCTYIVDSDAKKLVAL